MTKIAVVIDVFRAFSTAAYVLSMNPRKYAITTSCANVLELSAQTYKPLLIGKPEVNSSVKYHIPNSPTRVIRDADIYNREVIHRTQAGAKGIMSSTNYDIILCCGFVNAIATARLVKSMQNKTVYFFPMGHEAETPSLEDNLCADYIQSLLENSHFNLKSFITDLKSGPGKYFFTQDQWQYPREDFDICMTKNKFNFAIQAIPNNNYALLVACK